MLKVAYLCEPQVGGTYTFFCRMRPALAKLGVEFICVPPSCAAIVEQSRFASDEGIARLDYTDDPRLNIRLLCEYMIEHQINIVMTQPIPEILSLNILHYLPKEIGRMVYIPTITRAVMRLSVGMLPHVDHFVPVSPIVKYKMTRVWGIAPSKMTVIGSAINKIQQCEPKKKNSVDPIKLLYVGRLVDEEKGVLFLPKIAHLLRQRDVRFHMTIVGSGSDGLRLQKEFTLRSLDDYVTFTGAVSLAQVEQNCAENHVLVMPSRFEGSPHALLEGMSFGCVPVITNIRGATDAIIHDGKNGLLVSVGDTSTFAKKIAFLSSNQALYERMSCEATKRASEYTADKIAKQYLTLFDMIVNKPAYSEASWDLTQHQLVKVSSPYWKRIIPVFVKKIVRLLLVRLSST